MPDPATPIIYGIPNCDQIKKTRLWLDERGIQYQFYDFKKQGLEKQKLEHWLQQRTWIELVNRKGTTWRSLTPAQPATLGDAFPLMLSNPSLIKRPLLEIGDKLELGFSETRYAEIFL